MNTREVIVTRSAVESAAKVSTSIPLAEPVCGRIIARIAASTATATTTARPPGSISPATLRSALRRSPSNAEKPSPSVDRASLMTHILLRMTRLR